MHKLKEKKASEKAEKAKNTIPRKLKKICPASISPKKETESGTAKSKKIGIKKTVTAESKIEMWREKLEKGSESSKRKERSLSARSGTVIIEMYGIELKSGRKSVEPTPLTKNFETKKNLKAQKRIVRTEET